MAIIIAKQSLNGVEWLKTDTTPMAGLAAPIGSFATAADGSGLFYKFGAADTNWLLSNQIETIGVNISGQGNVLVAGELETVTIIPFTGTIIGWYLYETSATPIATTTEIDVWKSTYGAYPPVVAGTIWGTKPKLTTAIKNTATGLSIAVTQYDVLKYNLVSNDLAKNIRLGLILQKP